MQKPLKVQEVNIDKTRIHVDPGEIHRLLGEQQGQIEVHARDLVDDAISECLHVSSPEGAFVQANVMDTESTEVIKIPGMTFESGSIIHRMLRHAERYIFFLVTAGHGPESLAKSLLAKGNFLEGYIADLVASAIVDLAADQVEEQVKTLARSRGLLITNRYSPGYCSWNVKEQQKLFSLFPEKCCGISLSESCLMNPIKSISGIIGMGTKVKYRDYTCEICPMKDCNFRKARIS
jgi:hypothetical protein